ncbi:hypothetical protein [Actinophytocola glycyrrhizae]|uniref:Uncharacterized protein n=1 Tax=Actinophytocola glycyrrhizae TaxID=2044873 RepID=A0ABV9S6I6_9PSEU
MDVSVWRALVPDLKQLLRLPVEDGEGVRLQRAAQVETVHGDLAELVFGGAGDWTDQDDGWVAAALVARLTADQDRQLRAVLESDPGAALTVLADECVSAWRTEHTADRGLTGTDNSANWAANRVPGTLYFVHDGTQYRYSDLERGPDHAWLTLDERVGAAAERAQQWGTGWYTTAGEDPRYGGAYVYAVDRNGPWLTQAEAEQLLTTTAAESTQAATQSEAQQWADVWVAQQGGQWRYGLTDQGPFTYEDGAKAQQDKALLDQVTATLLDQYPDADSGYVRALAAQYVAETA